MKHKLISVATILILFTGLYFIGKTSRLLVFYKITTHEMFPNYNPNTWIVSSKSKAFTYNDVVCYKPSITNKGQNEIIIQRIAALEDDTVEINDGYLLRNGFMADNPQNLAFDYIVKRKVLKNMNVFRKLKEKPVFKGDTIVLCLTYNEFIDLGQEYLLHKVNNTKKLKDPLIYSSTNENGWNASNYGPVVVPKGYCFVLGDNRDNSNDSRFHGFIPVKNIVTTALFPL